jgi:hypothetical protein
MLLPTTEIKNSLVKVDALVIELTLLVRDVRDIIRAFRTALDKED